MPNDRVVAYGMEWHRQRSDAFRDLLIDPLIPYIALEIDGWDGVSPLKIDPTTTYIFCQIHPPKTLLETIPHKVVWIPMWDNVQHLAQGWWNRLPRNLRVVAFSEAVYQRAKLANLNVLRLSYFKNPDDFAPVTWHQGRVLLYWNRIGLVGPNFLAKMCKTLRVDKLLFRQQSDPSYAHLMSYQLPQRLGDTIVETLPLYSSREEYIAATNEANMVIAPRKLEGVGMVFLEAMARGSAVFAYDDATMNEYIVSGKNGYLFKKTVGLSRILGGVGRKLAAYGVLPSLTLNFSVRESTQEWEHIQSLDLQQLGHHARSTMAQGYARWQTEIEGYARFLLDS
jgi:glycosyltransferase involved in cell wall biosynthesis